MATAEAYVERARRADPNGQPRAHLEVVAPPAPADPFAEGTLSARWLSAWLGVEPAELERMERDGSLLGVPRGADGERAYPVWQFAGDGSVLKGTRRVIAAAAEAGIEPARLHGLMFARTGISGGGRLAGLLRTGHDEHVVSVIRAAGTSA